MTIEDRYLVFKYKDIDAYLNEVEKQELTRITSKVDSFRRANNKSVLQGVFVERDWNIYAQVESILKKFINPLAGCMNNTFDH